MSLNNGLRFKATSEPLVVPIVMRDVVSQVELLKLHRVYVASLDPGEAGQDREGHHAPTGPEPLWRPQRSLPSDRFLYEMEAAPPVRQIRFESCVLPRTGPPPKTT